MGIVVPVARFRRSRPLLTLALCALLCAACGATRREEFVVAGADDPMAATGVAGSDATGLDMTGMDVTGSSQTGLAESCDLVRMDGDALLEQEKDFTARYRLGERYTKTVMLFGGEPVVQDNVLSNAYIFGLDQTDAQALAKKYPDFYLCSSPGGMEASSYIVPYDLVPATCEIYDQIVTALAQYDENVASGGDRTSLRFDGAPLELESAIADATGEDVTAQASDYNFHLVTAVEQLTGESVLSFGTSP